LTFWFLSRLACIWQAFLNPLLLHLRPSMICPLRMKSAPEWDIIWLEKANMTGILSPFHFQIQWLIKQSIRASDWPTIGFYGLGLIFLFCTLEIVFYSCCLHFYSAISLGGTVFIGLIISRWAIN
jgi:hypothetical protein